MTSTSVEHYRAALSALLDSAVDRPHERVPIDRAAVGRYLAVDLVAADDLPRFDNSAMDGYAVALGGCADTAGEGPDAAVRLPVVGDVPAGSVHDTPLSAGTACRIMTGARVPAGADLVVPVELTDATPTGPAPQTVRVPTAALVPGRHIRRAGEDVVAGQILCAAGDLVTPAVVALARSAGVVCALVRPRVRVAVVATGAELAATGADPGAGGIHESNSDMVAAQAQAAGCEVVSVHVCGDEADDLRAELARLADARRDGGIDLLITTGGVSAGAKEVVRQVCEPAPGMWFGHVAMQPGAPQGHGVVEGLSLVCLPGTPVGAYVGFEMLLRPALDRVHGRPERATWTAVYAGPERRCRAGRVQFITGVTHPGGEVTTANSHHLLALAEATCLLEVSSDCERLHPGDTVTVHPL